MAKPEYLPPSLVLGGVPLIDQTFSWALTPGVQPYIQSFVVDKARSAQLRAVENPTTLQLLATGDTNPGAVSTKELLFEFVHLMQVQAGSYGFDTWQVADNRFSWRGKKIYCAYNITRDKNETRNALSGVPSNDPAALRADVDLFAAGRYLPWSVKTDEKPYTTKEILLLELAKLGIQCEYKGSKDYSYYIENVVFDGSDLYKAIAELLAMSRLQMTILRSGVARIYSLDFTDSDNQVFIDSLAKYSLTRPNKLYIQELKRLRPAWITVKFDKKMETRIIASSSNDIVAGARLPLSPKADVYTQVDINNRRVIACENVIPVPYPVKIDGRQANIGEYVPFWKYLAAIGITDLQVRTLWFGNTLERVYAAKIATSSIPGLDELGKDVLANHIVGAIRQHYRQTYRIEPFMMDRIRTWETRRCGVIDNYTHYTPPSPLWSDYCLVPRARIPGVAKRTALWSTFYYNWITNTRDPYRQRPTSGTIQVVNHQLGVFRLRFPKLIDGVIAQIIPSALTELPGSGISATSPLLTQTSLAEDHTVESLISVVWHVNEGDGYATKYHVVELDYTSHGGKGPEIEYLSRLEYARFAARESTKDRPGAEVIDPNKPRNVGIVETLAKAEAAKILNRYIDRVAGQATYAGLVPIEVQGNIKEIRHSFSDDRGLETIIDMRESLPDPTLEQTVSQKDINFIRRHVSRASDGNDLGGDTK